MIKFLLAAGFVIHTFVMFAGFLMLENRLDIIIDKWGGTG